MNSNTPGIQTETTTPENPSLAAQPPILTPKKHRHTILLVLSILLALLLAGGGLTYYNLRHCSYLPTENSYFSSPFVTHRNMLVMVPHEDDEVSLACGVIDAFTQAGSNVTIVFATNGDGKTSPEVRITEATRADMQMGVAKDHIVLLGYGDYISNPAFCDGMPNQLRTDWAGHNQTHGACGLSEYHLSRFGKPTDYTRGNMQADIRQLILDLRPDMILVVDRDMHVDHVSLSQIFDRAMGEILHEVHNYKPQVFKGFAYDYAWHGNSDFYQIPLKSATPQWAFHSREECYRWEERVRFPMPEKYLSYTLRGSCLRSMLDCFASQAGVDKQIGMQNGDKVLWERRTDALYGKVSATSGDASQLNDFRLIGSSDDALSACWLPDKNDSHPAINFSWDEPQSIEELVFYDAPSPAGDVNSIQVTIDGGEAQTYSLADGSGKPCRICLDRINVKQLSIQLVQTSGEPVGFSEIEVLPPRDESLQWIKLMDQDQDFCYELPCPAMQALALPLYGYPVAPTSANVTLKRDGEILPAPSYDGASVQLPPLPAGRYRLHVESGTCSDEIVLRVGDSMLWERGLQWLERTMDKLIHL